MRQRKYSSSLQQVKLLFSNQLHGIQVFFQYMLLQSNDCKQRGMKNAYGARQLWVKSHQTHQSINDFDADA